MHDLARVLTTEADWTALANSLVSLEPDAPADIDADLRLAAENARTIAALIDRVAEGQLTPAEFEVEVQPLTRAAAGPTDRVARWLTETCPDAVRAAG